MKKPPDASRRDLLRFLAGASVLPVAHLLGCDAGAASGPRGAGGAGGTGVGGAGGGGDDAWARGGTAAMTGKASYPDPFGAALATCAIVASTTEGPCTTENDLVREDVSEGWVGLPMRLALQVVDAGCEPLPGAAVKIWHTNVEGSYSGQTPSRLCLLEPAHGSKDFFRGKQTADAQGRVFFDSCFLGWYPGRAIHVHFQVESAGTTHRVSQLFFPEGVTREIFASHADYRPYGQPDTSFAADGVVRSIPAGERNRLTLEVRRMSDGAMLASKVIAVR